MLDPAREIAELRSRVQTLEVLVRQLQGRADLEGTGTPEGAVVGNVGDSYRRRDGGASTSFYVKESGVGTNTGWAAK